MILCSRVSTDVAHVTQICIAPEQRGRGLGRLLLATCAQSLLAKGFNALTLTVTEDNQPALRLYHWLGFTSRHRFDAIVVEAQFAQH
jgi:ribosomal protein S18 acetylase RimI-like enzyme